MNAERGSVLPLLLGVVAVAASLTLICAAATGIGTTRKSLYAVADASALAAAQSFALDLEATAPGEALDAARARVAAEAVLARIPTTDPVVIDAIAVDDGGTVTLTATTFYDTGIEVFGLPLRAPISVTVDSRAVVR
ncbi:hypothetical protein HQQ81_05785 [Microbacteriaceae bacterium VKM Ac-2854]|nr:hypothetical protein [Microbacteriaceae bacterium VKM Ac-2854]